MTHARRSFSHVLGAVAAAEQDGPPEALRAARLEARAFLQATVPNRHHLGQAIPRNTPSLVALLLDIHGPAAFGDVPASGTIRHVLGAAIRLGTVAPEILDILDRARLLGEMDAPDICDAALHADCPDLLAMATRLAGSTRTALDGCAPIPAAIACGPTLAPLLGAEMADRLGDPALPHAGMDVKEAALFAVLGHDLRPLAARLPDPDEAPA